MRITIGCIACLAGSAVLATPLGATPGSYQLEGFYRLHGQTAVWQSSDAAPWEVVSAGPWIEQRLLRWGYVPLTHDSQHYYCLIDQRPRTGTHVAEPTFVCGDPATVAWMFSHNLRPEIPLYGGH